MHREAFLKVKESHGITGKVLSEKTGVSKNHIYGYIQGKRSVTDAVLDQLVDAMEEISPGAKRDYCMAICGALQDEICYDDLDEENLTDHLIKLGEAWKRRQSRKTQILAS